MASLIKVDRITLERTLSGRVLQDSEKRFAHFLRTDVDGLRAADRESVSPAEKELELLLATEDVDGMSADAMADIGKRFFGRQHKVALANPTARAALEEALASGESAGSAEARAALRTAREEVRMKVVGYHDRWLAWLEKEGVIENRAGQTFVGGWIVADDGN